MLKESLAQQGGFGFALKGPQHDEAWLIFLDMVHNFMPTFEQKAVALHWFPMFRTWFGLCGLCKLPWNDIVPEDNKDTEDPAKVEKHLKWYAQYFSAVTGRDSTPSDLITMSEKVALLRRFRQEQYDKLQDAVYKRRGWTPDGIPTVETVKRLGIDFPEVMELLRTHGIE